MTYSAWLRHLTAFRHCDSFCKMKCVRWSFLCLLLLAGCASQYVITLNNGTKLTTASKPVLKNGRYHYKDGAGHENVVSEVRVRQIEPASVAEEEAKKNKFKPSPGGTKKHWYWPF